MPYALPSDPFFSVLVRRSSSVQPLPPWLPSPASSSPLASPLPSSPPPTPSSYTYISIRTNDDRLYIARCATRAPNRSGGRGDRGEADRWGVAPMLRDPKLSRRATLVECVCVNVSWYWNFLTLLRIRYPYSVLTCERTCTISEDRTVSLFACCKFYIRFTVHFLHLDTFVDLFSSRCPRLLARPSLFLHRLTVSQKRQGKVKFHEQKDKARRW